MPDLSTTSPSSPLFSLLYRHRGLMFPLACTGLILVVLFRLPSWVIDILLVGNLTLAAVILFTSIHVSDPLEFSVFPSLLLGTTLFRLVLNVATTRLILTAGDDGVPPFMASSAAGEVIRSFGQFVASGSLAVGFVIFAILVIIQFVVITKGATRISEVAARFTLDSMPGKQMAVDADLNAGLINESQAALRRDTIARESNFYGAMDGASKFVRGDAIASVLITLVNIIGGLCVGLLQHGWSLGETLTVFTTLTIGDGLVSQLPAFIIAISAGLIITRSTGRSDLGREMVDQLFGRPSVLIIAAIFLGLLLLTGLPRTPLLVLAGCLLIAAWSLRRSSVTKPADDQEKLSNPQHLLASADSPPAASGLSASSDYLRLDPLEVEVGFALLNLIEPSVPGNLLSRIDAIRRDVAASLGLLAPGVFAHDNVRLAARDYVLKVRGLEVSRGQVHPGKLLAVAPGFSSPRLDGLALTDPPTQRPAFWIPPGTRDHARSLRYTVFPSDEVLPRHLQHVIQTHASQLLTRQSVHALLADLAQRAPDLVRDIIDSGPPRRPSPLSVGKVHKVLQNLLAQGVPIRDLESILESLSDVATSGIGYTELTERLRQRLAGVISQRFVADDGSLHCLVLDPSAEAILIESLQPPGVDKRSVGVCLSGLADSLVEYVRALPVLPEPLVVLVAPRIRPALAAVLASQPVSLPVLAHPEIIDAVRIHPLASFSLPEQSNAQAALLTQQTLELFS
ncbi:MAG: flagellar type III secretion system protein FlhA [Actinobacteria bacterium]|nr:flagellar type III secretion system protein FlhA [Actinomycetota bacterium]